MSCPQCGYECPPDFTYCPRCGTFLHGTGRTPAPAGLASKIERLQRLVPREFAERLLATRGGSGHERRIVTILFADVVGSTAIAESLDPEDVLEVMNGAFDVLIEPVYRYEGTVARLMGDGILAFFGAPVAHEDDAERACRAALGIVAGARSYAERLREARGGEGFSVRVGINTGLVVVGEVGSDLRVEYTAMGDAINVASRMQQAAEPATVLIAEATHKLVAPLFETEALGSIRVKGRAEPVAAYRVLRSRAVPGKLRGVMGLASPMVGRCAELVALRQAVERVAAGEGGIATLVGDAGLGKSRLIAEVRKSLDRELGEAPIDWVEGRCLSYGASVPYLLWADVLRGLLGALAEDPPREVRDRLEKGVLSLSLESAESVLPYLATLMALPLDQAWETAVRDLSGAELREKTFRAVESFLASWAAIRPLVVVCEDLHWADPSSLDLLTRLVGMVGSKALLLICSLRPEGAQQAPRGVRLVAKRTNPDRHTDIWLEPLSAPETCALMGSLLQGPSLPGSIVEALADRSEGNPFYVEELLRSLIDAGTLRRDGATGAWRATGDGTGLELPSTLQSVLTSRIDRLAEGPKRVLRLASVIGRTFHHRVLESVASDQYDLTASLLTLERDEFILVRTRQPELTYTFRHELTREAAYAGLLKRERRLFHGKVARALESLSPERKDGQAGLLAYHWEQAGEDAIAVDYLHRAGDRARSLYAHAEAIGYYERALALLRQGGDPEEVARALMKLGLTYHNAFDFPAAHQAYDEGFQYWELARRAATDEQLPPAPHPLRVAWSDPLSLDPGVAADYISTAVIDQLFSGLVALTPELSVVPDVARRWQVLDDGRRYVFELRDDVHWSDGIPVTAGDFECAWWRVLDPATRSELADLLYDVRGARDRHQGTPADPAPLGVRALDDLTLEVELEGPTSYFLHLLTACTARPVPRHIVEAYGGDWADLGHIVTNGPFRLRVWDRGRRLVLERSPGRRGHSDGNAQQVHLLLGGVDDREEWLQAYDQDRLDIVDFSLMPAVRWDQVRNRHPEDYITGPALITQYIAFDVTRAPFNDRRVRQAVAFAIDRDALAGAALRGYGSPAAGGFVPPGMPGHSAGIGLPYDPQRGRRLLAEAGYPDGLGFPTLDPMQVLGDELAGVLTYLRAQLIDNLGIEVSWLDVARAEAFRAAGKDLPHLYVSAWEADFPDPASFLWDGGWWSGSGWRDEAYAEHLERARKTTNQEQRLALYQAADRILIAECPIIPLCYLRRSMLVKPWVSRSKQAGPTGWRSWDDLIIEPH